MNNQIIVAPLYEDYLAHHQIKGARWGIMHGPPYPLARGKGGRLPNVKKVTSEAKQRKAEQKAQKTESRAEEKKENLRKYIVEHPKALYKHKEMFSKEELEDILKEIDFDQKLKDVRRGQLKKTVDTAMDIAKGVTAVRNIAMSSVDLYKAGRDITSILKDHGTYSEVQERKKAEASKTEAKSDSKSSGSSESKGESKSSSSSETKSESKNAASSDSKSLSRPDASSTSMGKQSNSSKYETSSSELRNTRIDTISNGVSNNDSLITSVKPTTESEYRRKQIAKKGAAFLERLGAATPSTYRS